MDGVYSLLIHFFLCCCSRVIMSFANLCYPHLFNQDPVIEFQKLNQI